MPTLFCSNLHYDITETDLREAFEQFGRVTEVRLIKDLESGKSRGFAFVRMPSREEAEAAIRNLDQVPWNGRRVKCRESEPARQTDWKP